jgi:hypothetical protein
MDHRRPASDARVAPGTLGIGGRTAVAVIVVVVVLLGLTSGIGLLAGAPYAVVGATLAIRRPRHSIGWLLLALASGFAVVFVDVPASVADLVARTAPPLVMAGAVAQGWGGNALMTLFLLVTLVFPAGRLPTGRPGLAARAALGLAVAWSILLGLAPTISVTVAGAESGVDVPNPLAVLPGLPVWSAGMAGVPVLFLLAGAGVVSMFLRLRVARGIERAQLGWLAWSLAFILVGFAIGLVGDSVSPTGFGGTVWIPAEIAFPLPPVAIGIAIFRYRLYEIDRLVSRTIAYGILSAIVGALFVGIVLVLQVALSPVTQSSELAAAGSTLVVAALFQPIRRRIQRLVDRRFNRSRYDAERTVASFAGRLRDEVDLEALGVEIRSTVGRAVEPASVAIWLRT